MGRAFRAAGGQYFHLRPTVVEHHHGCDVRDDANPGIHSVLAAFLPWCALAKVKPESRAVVGRQGRAKAISGCDFAIHAAW